ncbi:ketoacyl-ACP synthase III [bacterium]|nr:ketoacyl-ACP synthase III [bacterium]MBU1635871.1 ketoacyl-ACP synthase III [bacterium]MBU1873492.1 ketoacyl-ACP synthase III [bacterium]
MYRSKIAGLGGYVPENVVTNFALEKMMNTSNEWIIERTGIHERRFVTQPCGCAELALPACHDAIRDAGIQKENIDLIIVATITPEHQAPGTSSFLQALLELTLVPTLDIRVQCSGFIYGMSIADQFIKTGHYQNILLVGVEVQSAGLNLTTEGRDIAVLFGDGAGAAIISRSDDDSEIISTHLFADGTHAKDLWVEVPIGYESPRISKEMLDEHRQYPYMNGRQVFKNAVIRFPEVVIAALEANQWAKEDIKLVIPHQANMRITEAITKRLDLPLEKVYSNIHRYGNTTAASIPLAMVDARKEGKFGKGDKLILAAFGSGFTWASAAVIW